MLKSYSYLRSMERIQSKGIESVPVQVTPPVDVNTIETLPFDMSPVAKKLENAKSPPSTFSSGPPKTFKEIARQFEKHLFPETKELPGLSESSQKEETPNVSVTEMPVNGPEIIVDGDVTPKDVPEIPVEEIPHEVSMEEIPPTQPSPERVEDLFHAEEEVRRKEQMQERDRMKPPNPPGRKKGTVPVKKRPAGKKVTPKKKAAPKPKAKSKALAKAKAKSKRAKVTEGQDGMAETGDGENGENGGDGENGEKAPEDKSKKPRAKKSKVEPPKDVSAEPVEPKKPRAKKAKVEPPKDVSAEPVEPVEPSGKKTFARRNRPLNGPGMIRWDSIKRVFIAHVASQFERPSSMEDWVEQGWP